MDESCSEVTTTQIISEFYSVLFPELRRRVHEQSPSTEPSSGAKPKSKPPLDINALDLFDQSSYVVDAYNFGVVPEDALRKAYRAVRRFLAIDAPMVELTKVCGACSNKLMVASDASTDVFCTNPECEVVYKQEDWVALLYAESDCT